MCVEGLQAILRPRCLNHLQAAAAAVNICTRQAPLAPRQRGIPSPWVRGNGAHFALRALSRMQSVVKQFLPPLHSAHRTISRVYSPASYNRRPNPTRSKQPLRDQHDLAKMKLLCTGKQAFVVNRSKGPSINYVDK